MNIGDRVRTTKSHVLSTEYTGTVVSLPDSSSDYYEVALDTIPHPYGEAGFLLTSNEFEALP